MMHMHPGPFFKPLFRDPSTESIKTAEAAIQWASEIEGEVSDYLHNIRIVARRQVVDDRTIGLAASIIASYQRHLSQLRMQELRAKRAEIASYVGEVGERRVFRDLYVEDVRQFDGMYGSSYLHRMGDKEGNVFIYWTSGGVFEAGKEITVKLPSRNTRSIKG
jgi:hypothetical protein